jgi:predicted enzyme related to lactoylglutathione lyase
VTKLVLTVLGGDDVQRSAAFYTTAFRWKVTVDAPARVELALPGGVPVRLYRRDGFARNTGLPAATVLDGIRSPAELHLPADNLQATIDRVTPAGGRMLSPLALRDRGAAVCFAAPDGHGVVVARPRPV